MFNLFKKNTNTDKGLREYILKEYMNPKRQKKAITEAAKKSAEDQNEVLTRYRQATGK